MPIFEDGMTLANVKMKDKVLVNEYNSTGKVDDNMINCCIFY